MWRAERSLDEQTVRVRELVRRGLTIRVVPDRGALRAMIENVPECFPEVTVVPNGDALAFEAPEPAPSDVTRLPQVRRGFLLCEPDVPTRVVIGKPGEHVEVDPFDAQARFMLPAGSVQLSSTAPGASTAALRRPMRR